jgi:hypothetical protein
MWNVGLNGKFAITQEDGANADEYAGQMMPQ